MGDEVRRPKKLKVKKKVSTKSNADEARKESELKEVLKSKSSAGDRAQSKLAGKEKSSKDGHHSHGKNGKAKGKGKKPSRQHDNSKSERPKIPSARRPMADLLDYLRACTKTLGEGLASKEEEVMLATRASEEMGDRVLLVAADQRGSRPLERLLRRAGHEVFASMFRHLMQAVPELGPNQYASHVLQSALASWAERLGTDSEKPPVEPIVSLCKSLKDDAGWSFLVHSPCGSHVVRALILALGGYAPGQDNRDRAAAKAGLLPEKQFDVPSEIVDCRRSVAEVLLQLASDDEELCLNAHASPVMSLLLRVLRDRGDRLLTTRLSAAIIGAPSIEKCERLVKSAPGSRLLEVVLETSTAESFTALFTSFFRPRLRSFVKGEAGDFGVFLAQRVADGLRDENQLILALGEVDFAACLTDSSTPAQQSVVVKFVEACLRVRGGLKQCAAEVFRALDLRESSEYHRVWQTLLTLQHTESPADLLRTKGKGKGDGKGKGSGSASADEPKEGEGSSALTKCLKSLPAAGPQLLAALLRFPANIVQPLNSGLPKLLEHSEVLVALAREGKTARVLEAALAPSSALLPKLRARLARGYKGTLGGLGPHPVGGWVCAALWRASLGDTGLREAFAKELLDVEEDLRAHNFAVWKVCGLHQAKVRQEEWASQQEKASKTKRLFDSILEDGDPEAAKAAALQRKQKEQEAADREAQLRADPTIVGLLPADADNEGAEPEIMEDDGDHDAELDELFAGGRRKARKKKHAEAVEEAPTPSAFVKHSIRSKEDLSKDSSLLEALQLISGRAPAKVRKRQAQEDASDNDGDDSDGEKKSSTAVQKRKKKKKRRVE